MKKQKNNILKQIMLSVLYFFLVFIIIFAFYGIKNIMGLASDFEFSFTYFFNSMLKSVALFFNILITYVFFIKLIITKKSVSKAKNAILIWILVLIINIILNELLIYLLYNLLNIDLVICNVIIFITLYLLNKQVKKQLIKKRG